MTVDLNKNLIVKPGFVRSETGTDRLDDPLLLTAAVLPHSLQHLHVVRQAERLREEAKLLLPKMHLHPGQISP